MSTSGLAGQCVGLLLALTTAAADPTPEQGLQEGKAFAQTQTGRVADAARAPDFTTVPGYRGTEVPQRRYYEAGPEGAHRAYADVPAPAAARFVRESAVQRPRFVIDANDALLQRSPARAPTRRTHDCASTPTAAPAATESKATCSAWGLTQPRVCQKKLRLACQRPFPCEATGLTLDFIDSDLRAAYTYPYLTLGTRGDNLWRGPCTVFDRRTRFTLADVHQLREFTLVQAGFDDWMRVQVNGRPVYVGPYGGDRLETRPGHRVQYGAARLGPCELGTSWQPTLAIDLKPYLRTGANTLDLRVVVAGAGEGWMKFKVTQACDCAWTETWTGSCAPLEDKAREGLCVRQSRTCAAPPETRHIDGRSVHRDCWRVQETYACATGETREEPYCQALRDRGCRQVHARCVHTLADGRCDEFRQTYQCGPAPPPRPTAAACGPPVHCLDGRCFGMDYTPNADFAVAASHLGALATAAQDFDASRMDVFQGDPLRCSQTALQFADCCRDRGWGTDLSLAQCSTEARTLATRRAAGQCHYLGRYCSKDSPLGCRVHQQSYCCFSSKLARVLQQQGRAQLGIAWGTARAPACRGLTPAELTRLDFSQIDLAEVYSDVLNAAEAARRPSATQLQHRLRQRLQRLSQ